MRRLRRGNMARSMTFPGWTATSSFTVANSLSFLQASNSLPHGLKYKPNDINRESLADSPTNLQSLQERDMEIYLYTSEQEPNGSDETFEHCEAGTIPEAQYIVIDNSLCGRRVMGNFSDDNKITIGIANKTDCTGHVFVSVYENDVREIRIDGVSETDLR